MAYFSNLVTPQQTALQNKTNPLSGFFGGWQYTGLPKYTQTPNATSVTTKQPVYIPPPPAPKVSTAPTKPLIPTGGTATGGGSTGTATATPVAPRTYTDYTQGSFTLTPEQRANAKTPEELAAAGAPREPRGTTGTTTTTPGFGGILGSLVSTGQGNVPIGESAADIAARYAKEYEAIGKRGEAGQAGYLSTGTTPVAQGLAAIVAGTEAKQKQAVSEAESAALQGTGQQLTAQGQAASALGTAGGLIPEALRYGGVGGTTGLDPATQLQTLAKAVATGGTTGMDYGTAYTQLSNAYGPVIANQLLGEIQKINPAFNVALSKASPGTQAVGQQAAAAAPAAYQALDALQTAYDNLPDLAKGNIPGVGANVPWLQGLTQALGAGTGVARPQISAFQGALTEARAQVDAVLAPIIGVDAARAQAGALLPDNMAPTELPQKIQAAKTYIEQRIASYTASGGQPLAVGGTDQNASSNPPGWF